MWLKNNGFYMAELLVSLSGWLIITGILIPMFLQANKQIKELEQKSDALHLLYEYVQTVMIEKSTEENIIMKKGNTQYEINWQEGLEDGKREVFITYENVFGKMVQLHELVP